METWYECNGSLKRVILHVRVQPFVDNLNEIEDLCNVVRRALDSFTAFTKRDPRNMYGVMPTIWISRSLSKIYCSKGADQIFGMPVHVASMYSPYELTIEWRDEEFVNQHTLEAPRYRYTNYIPDNYSRYRRLPLNYDDLVIDKDNGKGGVHFYVGRGNGKSLQSLKELERMYCEADVKATHALWTEFCGRGGYTKSHTIKKVIFNDPATIVYWTDGTKTVVKRQPGDKKFDPEKGLAMAYVKHELGLKEFNKLLENAEVHNEKKR